MQSDAFWSYFAMPIGVLICFGPALVAWLLSEDFKGDAAEVPVKVSKKD